MKIKKINPENTPHAKNMRFIKWLEKQNIKAYRFVMLSLIQDIIQVLTPEKLQKSDDGTKLPRGWTGEIPKIELDVLEKLKPLIQKRLKVFEWLSIGDYASKDAIAEAKVLGLIDEFTPGSVISAYLHAIDTERDYYTRIFQEAPKDLPPNLVKASIEEIAAKAKTSLDYMTSQIQHNVLESVTKIIEDHNKQNLDRIHYEASDAGKISRDQLSEVAERAQKYIDEADIRRALKQTVKAQERNTVLGVQDQIAKGASTGFHQAMYEMYSSKDGDPEVIWVTKENDRVCKFCATTSKHPDGTYKHYKLSDFKPYGSNKGLKQANWVLTVPPIHISCYCWLVYVPKGFTVLNGDIVKKS